MGQVPEPLHGPWPDPRHFLQLLDRPERPPIPAKGDDRGRLRGPDPRKLLEQLRSGAVEVDREQIGLDHAGRLVFDEGRTDSRFRARNRAEKDPHREKHEDVALLARHAAALPGHAAGRFPFRYR